MKFSLLLLFYFAGTVFVTGSIHPTRVHTVHTPLRGFQNYTLLLNGRDEVWSRRCMFYFFIFSRNFTYNAALDVMMKCRCALFRSTIWPVLINSWPSLPLKKCVTASPSPSYAAIKSCRAAMHDCLGRCEDAVAEGSAAMTSCDKTTESLRCAANQPLPKIPLLDGSRAVAPHSEPSTVSPVCNKRPLGEWVPVPKREVGMGGGPAEDAGAPPSPKLSTDWTSDILENLWKVRMLHPLWHRSLSRLR